MGLFDKLKEKLIPEKTTLMDDIPKAEAWLVENMNRFGYPLDGTLESFAVLDRFFDDNRKPGGRLDGKVRQMQMQLFAVGCYMGQVLCRELGGTWLTDDKDRDGAATIGVKLPDGRVARPVQRAIHRFAEGGEQWSFVSFGEIVSHPPAPKPEEAAEEPGEPEGDTAGRE